MHLEHRVRLEKVGAGRGDVEPRTRVARVGLRVGVWVLGNGVGFGVLGLLVGVRVDVGGNCLTLGLRRVGVEVGTGVDVREGERVWERVRVWVWVLVWVRVREGLRV